MVFLNWLKNAFIDDLFVGMDLGQFIPSLVATIVGIFVPFLIQRRVDKNHRINDALQHLCVIRDELLSVKDQIAEIARENFDGLHLAPIKTPIWDGLRNSNGLILISELHNELLKKEKGKKAQAENTIAKKDWYERIFSVYSGIDEYNRWWNLYSDKVFEQGTKDVLYSIEKKLRSMDGASKIIDGEAQTKKNALTNIEKGITDLGDKLCEEINKTQELTSQVQQEKIPPENITYLIMLINEIINSLSKPSKEKKKK
ncbi:MAG: hypothetical protein HDQ88_11490 [Clostridia bacterium]|nr:hypothetical protein [Clostridia bacterium]